MKQERKRNYQTKVGQERRRHITLSTKILLESQNVHEITLKHIADQADIPLTSIYNLFTNLDSIYSEIVDEIWAELLDYRKNNLKPAYNDFCKMVAHSTQLNIEFIRQNTLIKKVLYSEYMLPAIKYADTKLLHENIRIFVSTQFPHAKKDELDAWCEKFRKGIVCFDALVLDCLSRNGNILKSDEDEIVEMMIKLSS